MPLLTVRLTVNEMERLRVLAGERGVSALVRRWIAGQEVDTSTPPVDMSTLPFLRAPDDDCPRCGHDRQSYHLGALCTFLVAPRSRCGCVTSPDEPF